MIDPEQFDEATIVLLWEEATGAVFAGDYVDWALAQLEAGKQSRRLLVLAGMGTDSMEEIRKEFRKTLQEMSLLPDASLDVYFLYARYMARQMLEGKVTYVVACRDLAKICAQSGYRKEFSIFSQLEDLIDDYSHDPVFIARLLRNKDCTQLEDLVRDECFLFLELHDAILPRDIYAQVYCTKCGNRSLPVKKRRLFRSGTVWDCSICGRRELVPCNTVEGRKLIVRELRQLGVRTLPERGTLPK